MVFLFGIFQEGKVIDEFTIIKTFHGSYDKTGKKRALELPINLIEVNQRIGQAAKQNLP
uniref:Uncharacterized protein n=1 Tax=Arion vulgaris TaxID=1028688 RepID=A0A0B6ZRQ8_9EUPU